MSDSAQITVTQDEGIVRLGLNRPEKKNALCAEMYGLLAQGITDAEGDPQIRVMMIHGTPDCFTAGNDLQDFMNAPPTEGTSTVFGFLEAIAAANKPLIAAVTGPAIGIGTTLLLHCDMVLAGEHATLQLPFVNLGLCPEAASSYLLPQLMGHQRAAELLLLGKPLSPQKACEFGLVNHVLPDGEVFDAALQICRELAELPPSALRDTKRLMKQNQTANIAEAMKREGETFLRRLKSPEAREAFTAFFERRPPDFSRFQ